MVLASQKAADIDERVVAAMGASLSEAAYKAAEEMGLSLFTSMEIKYKEDYIICRNISLPDGDTQFVLAVLSKLPESEDVQKYFSQLLDWAVENAKPDLVKLASI